MVHCELLHVGVWSLMHVFTVCCYLREVVSFAFAHAVISVGVERGSWNKLSQVAAYVNHYLHLRVA